jgi:hypothetical protein
MLTDIVSTGEPRPLRTQVLKKTNGPDAVDDVRAVSYRPLPYVYVGTNSNFLLGLPVHFQTYVYRRYEHVFAVVPADTEGGQLIQDQTARPADTVGVHAGESDFEGGPMMLLSIREFQKVSIRSGVITLLPLGALPSWAN